MRLELSVDPASLFFSDDPQYLAWLSHCVDRVARERRAENEKAKAK